MTEEGLLSAELLAARRALEGIQGIALLKDWTWHASSNRWVLYCRLSPDVLAGGPIPSSSDWYVLVDAAYPGGSIKLCPAKGGLAETFPHQSYNGGGGDGVPWRDGDLCLNTDVHVLGRMAYDSEPYDVHTRLKWHIQRALEWLRLASRGELLSPGDPFELPDFPVGAAAITVAFSEGLESFPSWQAAVERFGLVDLVGLANKPGVLLVKRLRSLGGRILIEPTWGRSLISAGEKPVKGIWLRLDQVPIVEHWRIPCTWRELREACKAQDIDLDRLMEPTMTVLRDGQRHIALLGFPIPLRIGDAPQQMHWQAVRLPAVSWKGKTAKGFRANELGYWRRDRAEILCDEKEIQWCTSENWAIGEISTRGRLPDPVARRRMLFVGAGALGSVIAELLVRAGVCNMMIMDGDSLQVGNLVRHTLVLDELEEPKAEALARRLNRASPHANVSALSVYFPPTREQDSEHLQQYDVIVDCSGSDDVPRYLERFPWSTPRLFFSLSLGFRAQRLFCFAANRDSFPRSAFVEALQPWLAREFPDYARHELPREGVGCWHPLFPARIDDIWMLGAVAVKQMTSLVIAPPATPELTVFEQHYDDDAFVGVRRASLDSLGV